jgi:hypothetical protein
VQLGETLTIYYDDDLGMEQEEVDTEPKAKLYSFDFKKAAMNHCSA